MFINCTNHNTDTWSEKQLLKAKKYGDIVTVPFPNVNSTLNEIEIESLAEETVEKILGYNPDVVLCQGEFTVTYSIVRMLKEKGIRVVAACSERNASEQVVENGKCERKSIFEFIQFREYV